MKRGTVAARGSWCVGENKCARREQGSIGEETFHVGRGMREPRGSAGEGKINSKPQFVSYNKSVHFTIIVEFRVCSADEQLYSYTIESMDGGTFRRPQSSTTEETGPVGKRRER